MEQRSKDRLILYVLLAHLGLIFLWSLLTDHWHLLGLGTLTFLVPLLAYTWQPGSFLSRSVISLSLTVYSAIIIHLSNGLVEMHFHIFAALVLLSIYYDWRLIIIAAIFIAVHHLVGLLASFYQVYAPNPDLFIYSLHIIFVGLESVVLCYLCEISRRRILLINHQNSELKKALQTLEGKRQFEQGVNEQIIIVTAQLNSASSQQIVSSSGQVRAINEVATAMQELTATARQIASSAERVEHSAREMRGSAEQVQQTALQAADTGGDGQKLVETTVTSIVEVGQLYQGLIDTLLSLSLRAKDIRKVFELISSISAETHLLALNAAIEAAGAGEYGSRFAIVAQEVKALAGRSQGASSEVGSLVQRIEEAVEQAVRVTAVGHLRVGEAISLAEQGGKVINKLAGVTNQAAKETAGIAKLSQEVKKMAEEIGFATRQQQKAGEQVVDILNSIITLAYQNSASSDELSKTANILEDLSLSLRGSPLVLLAPQANELNSLTTQAG